MKLFSAKKILRGGLYLVLIIALFLLALVNLSAVWATLALATFLLAVYIFSDASYDRDSGKFKKSRICSVRRNFYVIIPPEYLSQRILPPTLFIDDLMKFAEKPYYVGLLNAAGFYGASHQQPQEFFVVTVKPALRTVSVRGIIINFVITNKINCDCDVYVGWGDARNANLL